MPHVDVTSSVVDLLTRADQALTRTVDSLADDAYAEPSLLPRWTRSHVIAHLALNAEGLERVVRSIGAGTPEAMYESDQARDDDIEVLAHAEPSEVRDRLLAATTCLSRALENSHNIDADARFERTPGGVLCPVSDVAVLRLREVEIHHADLGVDYSPADWSTEFAVMLLDAMTARPHPVPFVAVATDVDGRWHCGAGAGASDVGGGGTTVVNGSAAAIGWWLTGRGDGSALTCESGALPRIDS